MTRVRVEFDLADEQYVASVICDAASWPKEPLVRRLARGQNFPYPLPDSANESAAWKGKLHAELCEDASGDMQRQFHKNILIDPTNEQLEKFGRYLYAVAFGPVLELLEKSEAGLQIEIFSTPAAAFLDSMPWELMWRDEIPLIAEGDNSISRIIDSPKLAGSAKLELPPRVLFVVGELDDQLRPGAEYLAILESLSGGGNGEGRKPGAALHLRSITNATITALESAVQNFAPQIVHVVAHGTMNREKRAVIRLGNPQPGKPDEFVHCRAEDLLKLLTPKGMQPPALVLVNACHTANNDIGDARAFAADLVRGGVPVSIGMSGEVASRACRRFARAFYGELAGSMPPGEGEPPGCPIRRAFTSGQAAARLSVGTSKLGVDWARPSLFIAKQAVIEVSEALAQRMLAKVLANITGNGSQAMLGRGGSIRDYEKFIANRGDGAARVLAFAQSDKRDHVKVPGWYKGMPFYLGKTMLMWELQARALLDGYVPCLLQSIENVRPKPNYLALALELADVMDELRGKFGIDQRHDSNALRLASRRLNLASEATPKAAIDITVEFGRAIEALKDQTGPGVPDLDPRTITECIRQDVQRLVDDVRVVWPGLIGALVMIDDLHLYKDAHRLVLQAVNEHGLGTPTAPAPLIITFNDFDDAGKALLESLSITRSVSNYMLRSNTIVRFPENAEGRATYSNYLLSRKFAQSRGNDRRERFTEILGIMHRNAYGVPTYLDAVDSVIETALSEKPSPLVAADEEAVFAAGQSQR